MLGDVEVDWSMPRGYGVRSMHQTDGTTDDLLVCIPLPGRGRYRMSMLVPDDLPTGRRRRRDRARLRGARTPELHHIQAVLDRLVPGADDRAKPAVVLGVPDQPPHRRRVRPRPGLRRRRRRAHPPADRRAGHEHRHPGRPQPGLEAGAGGVGRRPPPALLDSYDAERRPVGEEVVGRTVRSAREGIGADSTDPDFVIRREAPAAHRLRRQPDRRRKEPAGRAPDATGLTRTAVTGPIRLFSLLGRREHTMLLVCAGRDPTMSRRVSGPPRQPSPRRTAGIDVYLIASPGADVDRYRAAADPRQPQATSHRAMTPATARRRYVVRPDGYRSLRLPVPASTPTAWWPTLAATFAPLEGGARRDPGRSGRRSTGATNSSTRPCGCCRHA